MESVAVTGGAGFIGSHLCDRLLNEGYKVVCIDNLLTGSKGNIEHLLQNPQFAFVDHDVTRPFDSREYRVSSIEYVFHLASPASPNHHSKISYHALPMETMLANTIGTMELLRLAEQHRAKFLFTSTSEIYGDPLEHPQREEYRGNVSPIGPRSIYDESKRFGETITAYFWRDKNVDARIARLFNTYGPRMRTDDQRMIVTFINQALSNQNITYFGDGRQTRSLCYIDDTVEGLMHLMFYPNTNREVVNIGSQEEHTVLEYATLIKRLVGADSEVVSGEDLPEDDPRQRQPDITKAKKLLGWEPKVGLEEGLKRTIEYFKTL